MPDEKVDPKRAERMVDFGLEEAMTTFDLGPAPTDEEVEEMGKKLDAMKPGDVLEF